MSAAPSPDINFAAVRIQQLVDKAAREVFISISTDEVTIGITFPVDLDAASDQGIPLLWALIDGFPHLMKLVISGKLDGAGSQLIDLRPGCQEDLT